MKEYRVLFLLSIIAVFTSCQTQTVWNIKEYGAKADAVTVNTKVIQSVIDDCSKAGGGTVLIEGGTYLSGTLLLKSNVNLKVAEGATLMASVNPNDFVPIDPFIDATGQYRGQCFIGAMDVENISITGKGTIDGQGKKFTPGEVKKTLKRLGIKEKIHDYSHLIAANSNNYVSKKIRYGNRPFLVRFVRVKKSSFKDVKLCQPAAWTLHLFQCETFLVDGIHIHSHANRNNDGIDIDSSKDGKIINSHVDSDDDAICFKGTSAVPSDNILVENCEMSSGWGSIKFGTESMGDFKNITVKNCHVYNTRGGGIKVLSVDGANIDNILIDNITMENVEMPIFIRLGERRLTYRGAKQRPVGSINNVTISNIKAVSRKTEDLRVAPTVGFFFTGTPNHKIGSIKLENIDITLPGGGTEEHANIVVPENETQYPEFTKLGVTPAYGIYARHIEKMEMKNISIKSLTPDARQKVIMVDVNK